jgi:hypothetical protein
VEAVLPSRATVVTAFLPTSEDSYPRDLEPVIPGAHAHDASRCKTSSGASDPQVEDLSLEENYIPPFVSFGEIVPIYQLLDKLRLSGSFSIGGVKRAIKKAMATVARPTEVPDRPDAFDVDAMYDPVMFQGGKHPLPKGDSPLNVIVMDAYHVESCSTCIGSNQVVSGCYWYGMRDPLENGWVPPIHVPSILPLYAATGADGNHRSASIFPATIEKELAAQVELGICTPFLEAPPGVLVAPLGASLRSSDRMKAVAITGITLSNQETLDQVNVILLEKGHSKIKVRPIHDATAVGLNAASYVAHFANSGIDDAIPLISEGCYMGKLDVSRFFHNFPLAPEVRFLFWVFFGSIFYQMNRVIFGLGNAPYFTSGYGAEIRKWILFRKIPAVHYCDDHFTSGENYASTKANLAAIAAIFLSIGFAIAMEKFEIGQRLVYLGILFDSIRMTMSFDPLSAAGFHSELTLSLSRIIAGDHLTHGEIRHIAGKLSHYSQVCQSGRIHLRWWWIYLHYGSKLSVPGIEKLVRDSEWWLELLHSWKDAKFSGLEYPIFSSSAVMGANTIVVLQSDASGPHGFGYISGYLDALDPPFYSARWMHSEERICDTSSHYAELRALQHYVTTTIESHKILLWVSDSQSAVYSVNNGSCHEEVSLELLSSVLTLCDAKHIYIIALWIPREQNLLPDYLSHLSFSINSESTSGKVSDFSSGSVGEATSSSGGRDQEQEE